MQKTVFSNKILFADKRKNTVWQCIKVRKHIRYVRSPVKRMAQGSNP
ncbi:hypothetical protein [Escherichia phage vB_EcoM_ULIM8]|nr:hypothetical protein [Escherichia phage vB_EcoM_ULIM8]